jgi:P27 family predicted phage terminase small subunit
MGNANSGGALRKSPTQHKASGTYQPVRHAGYQWVTAPDGRPVKPGLLEGEALKEWRRMVRRLDMLKVLSVVDDAAIFQYARLWGEVEELAVAKSETTAAIKILEQNIGTITKDDLLPFFQELTKLRQIEQRYLSHILSRRMAIRQFLVEFGMTPSARGRIKLPTEKPATGDIRKAVYAVGA